jgi:hypothetical protein
MVALADAVGVPLAALLMEVQGGEPTSTRVVRPSTDLLAIELPPGEAFEVARMAAAHTGRPIHLINPVTRELEQTVGSPTKRPAS